MIYTRRDTSVIPIGDSACDPLFHSASTVHPDYHAALLESAMARTRARAARERGSTDRLARDLWSSVTLEREGASIFVTLEGKRLGDNYLARVDASRFPVEPYEVGFIKPATPRADRLRVSDRDPRYWPWSPMPGLHGSFNLHFPRAIRVFWCRECTASYFFYHGHEAERRWQPAQWPLEHLVDQLGRAVKEAEHARHWRPVQRGTWIARARGAGFPSHAGLDDA